MNVYWDVESNGFLNTVDHMHCSLFLTDDDHWEAFNSYEVPLLREYMKYLKSIDATLVGHNIIPYDIPLLDLLFGIKWEGKVIDTLVLSKLLYPDRKRHSLGYLLEAATGEKKVTIENWIDDSDYNYYDRCQTDVLGERTVYHRLMKNQVFLDDRIKENWI